MLGSVKDVPGECNARLEIADDHGDNHATMRCALSPGHEGKHREVYKSRNAGEVIIEWERDVRIPVGEPLTVDELVNGPFDDEDS